VYQDEVALKSISGRQFSDLNIIHGVKFANLFELLVAVVAIKKRPVRYERDANEFESL
jgi:hypothetical protein